MKNKTIADLPNIGATFQAMKIMLDVQNKVAGKDDNFIAFTINTALKNNRPYKSIIHTIAGMAGDNYNAIAGLIGSRLTDECLGF